MVVIIHRVKMLEQKKKTPQITLMCRGYVFLCLCLLLCAGLCVYDTQLNSEHGEKFFA